MQIFKLYCEQKDLRGRRATQKTDDQEEIIWFLHIHKLEAIIYQVDKQGQHESMFGKWSFPVLKVML